MYVATVSKNYVSNVGVPASRVKGRDNIRQGNSKEGGVCDGLQHTKALSALIPSFTNRLSTDVYCDK
jgi:hypothetical protein